MPSSPTIGTHSGSFHCDEALACFLLHQTNEFENADIVRTRDQAILDQQSIVVDVGGIYDPSRHRYDHHQRGFFETFDEHHKIKLSSAGLIYKHFGKEVIRQLSGINDEAEVEVLHRKMYDNFIKEIDAIDNGVEQYEVGEAASDKEPERPFKIAQNYHVTTNLSHRVSLLHPLWNEKTSNEEMDQRFLDAVKLTGSEFKANLNRLYKGWLPARTVVLKAVEQRFSVDDSGRIILLESSCPWKEHLFEIEDEMKLSNKDETSIIYVLYRDSDSVRVQCVPSDLSSFQSRKLLPEPWRGIRDSQLSEISKIKECVFVHASGFIGGNKTLEGALQMAHQALRFCQQ